MITTKCVGAVMLTETRDALHGAQIPEITEAPDARVWLNRICCSDRRPHLASLTA